VAKVAHSSQVRTDASAFFYSCFRFPQAIRKEIYEYEETSLGSVPKHSVWKAHTRNTRSALVVRNAALCLQNDLPVRGTIRASRLPSWAEVREDAMYMFAFD
jgi:hypothetical protein